MKKIITKFWGLALIVVLLSSMFVAAAPVSANALQYSAETFPNTPIFGTITGGVEIWDMAINGDTAYVASDNNTPAAFLFGLRKSTNGGATFAPMTVSAAGVNIAHVNMVAVAADDPNFVVVVDTITAPQAVWVSTNGGSTWSNLGAPRNAANAAASAINSVAVSPTHLGGHFIAVGGRNNGNTAPGLFVFNTAGGLGTGWYDAVADGPNDNTNAWALATNYTNVYAVQFSPAFAGDLTAVFVTDNGTDANLHTAQFTPTGTFDSFPGYTGGVPIVAATAITAADLALFPDFSAADETLRNAFVALTAAPATANGLFRVNDTTLTTKFTSPTGVTGLNSVAYDGSSVVVGAYDTNLVAFSNAPLAVGAAAVLTPNRPLKRSGINAAGNDQMIVGFVGTTVVSVKRGAESAFAVSTDGGLSFNDISLVNSAAAALTDIAYNADATKKYALIDTAAATSFWRFDGSWVRALTLDRVTYAATWIVRTAPESFDSVYIGDLAGTDIFYSSTAGATWNTKYTAPGAINDIAVESADVVYVAYGNLVAKSTNHAFYFGTGAAPGSTWVAVQTIKSYGANQILVTSGAGQVQWSTDGGVTYQTFLAPGLIAGATTVYAVADKLEAGGIIYAATAANANVYRWTIGTSAVWDQIGTGGPVGAPPVNTGIDATYLSTDIALANGTLYRIGTSGANTEISRSINPSFPVALLVAFTSVQTTGAGTTMAPGLIPATGAAANAASAPLKMVGNTAYFIDTISSRVLTFTDTLAAATAAPALTTPANDALVQTNPSTGTANPVTFTWAAVTGAQTYTIAIAQDTIFLQPVAGYPKTLGFMVANEVTAANLFTPGQTYYWRVRVATPYLTAWSEVRTFRVQPTTAVVPSIGSPANGTVLSGSPAFSWSPIGGATMYKFELDTGTSFTAPLYSIDTPNAGASLPVNISLEPGRTYFWRVKALSPIEGDWSTVANFTVAAEATATTPPVTTQPTFTITQPTTITSIIIPTQEEPEPVSQAYIWAIIIIGAVLVIAVIVLIVRTRRSV